MFPRIVSLFVLYLVFCSLLVKGEPGKCRDGVFKDLTSHQLLRLDVFCSYDKTVRPVIQYSSNITVNMKMFIKFFTLSWNDAHLKWTPSDYGNISALHVHTKEIWVPDLDIYNSGNMESYVGIKGTICVVYPKGHVLCVPVAKWPVHCKPNLRQWPFDSHECTMTIGSWTHAGELIDIQLQNEGVSLSDFQESREWELTNATAVRNVASYDCCPNLTYPSIVYKFNIKRHASAYLATVIMPSLIMVVMTLSTFGLDPKAPHRLVLCSISILCHCLYLQYLGIKLPSNGNMTPVIDKEILGLAQPIIQPVNTNTHV
ncbi:acetylcholine receptor subunit alpha-1-A-like [Hetaerina americana]|uniref:acetylcholine receptor subunit alpha-1-A-like n=1 Tax=Hetaerina americana TaxID=62018 RepID=UPI003A7F1BA9